MILVRGKALIKNNWMRVNILISDSGKIVKIYRSLKANRYFLSKVDKIFIAEDSLILPGIIDIHVHMREPGQEHKETFESGTKAAIASGITIIGDMPNNLNPITTSRYFMEKLRIAERKAYSDFFLYLMFADINAIRSLAKNSKVFVKIYLYRDDHYKALLENIRTLPKENVLYVFHAEHPNYLKENQPTNALELNSARPPRAEVEGVKLAIKMAEYGYDVHVTHISTGLAAKKLEEAMRTGLRISYDVAPHHIIFYLERIDINSPLAKVYPPIRPKRVRDSLLKILLKDGVPILATDHAPHAPEEKRIFVEAPPGINSIQYFLPLVYSLSKKFHLEFSELLKKVTLNPARRFGMPLRGQIKVGYWADLVIFDHKRKWIVDPDYCFSKAKHSIYDGLVLLGQVTSVFLRGNLVFHKNAFLKRIGKYIFNLD